MVRWPARAKLSCMKDHILSEIRRIAAESGGKVPGAAAFENATRIRPQEWRGRYWARWGDAVAEAGLERNRWNERLDRDSLLEILSGVVRHFGHFPTFSELDMYRRNHPEAPNPMTVSRRFEGYRGAEDQLRQWCASREAFSEVATLLGPAPPCPARKVAKRADAGNGCVYLIRSGQFFKIGHTDNFERRVKQITIALPEPVKPEHLIRTDDPAGIEAYWHRRFADRRANGEWFRLTAADVAVFKRRRFQ